MSPLNASDAGSDFFQLAAALGLLSPQAAEDLRKEAVASGLAPVRMAHQSGLLGPVEIDIVESLQRPEEVAPGYEVLGLIGRGGMGVVYRARQRNLDRLVALKTVLLSQMADANFAARFEQEARTVGRLRHPHIVSAYDFGRHQGRLYLAMELFEGQDADTHVQREGPFDENTAWAIARQAAAGLAHAAQAGVVHRDVKPANLLLAAAPEGFSLPAGAPMVKIADFGLAFMSRHGEVNARLTSSNSVVGSPHYMAPEQLTGDAVDWRADVYSLGATVWHLIAGEPPFNESAVSRIIVRKLSEAPPSLQQACPQVSSASDALVRRMLSPSPADRFASYGELLAAIDALLARDTKNEPSTVGQTRPPADWRSLSGSPAALGETAVLPRVSTHETPKALANTPPRGQRRRHVWLFGLVGLAAMIAAGLLGWKFFGPARLPDDRVLKQVGWSTHLFDGESLKGWRIESGGWRVESTPEGRLMSGQSGSIRRQIVRETPAGRVELDHYRITLVTQTHEASAIDVQFGIAGSNAPAHCLRIDADEVQFGLVAEADGDFEPTQPARKLAENGPDSLHVIHLERQPENWWVFVDGRLAAVAKRNPAEQAEFRLRAVGGPAWFSDLAVEELVAEPADAQPSMRPAS